MTITTNLSPNLDFLFTEYLKSTEEFQNMLKTRSDENYNLNVESGAVMGREYKVLEVYAKVLNKKQKLVSELVLEIETNMPEILAFVFRELKK